jgi:hypothetical protein
VNEPQFVIFMKVGVHAGETLESIVSRKRREEAEHGSFLWGYGGTLCHPLNQVAALVDEARGAGHDVVLAMIETQSRHVGGSDLVASHASADGQDWAPLAPTQVVRGSRYALVGTALERCDLTVDLSAYAVAAGPSTGQPVSTYVRGRVDKACATRRYGALTDKPRWVADKPVKLAMRARLLPPHALFVR